VGLRQRLSASAEAVAGAAWMLLQGTAAATVAWVIAKHLVNHHEPFFAPIAAVIALNAPLGERGLNTVRLLLGVVAGILSAELAIAAFGDGYLVLAAATFVAMAIAMALGGARIVIGQAAASAIITVAVSDGHYGVHRLEDALIGTAVALVFTQILFSPEPVALLRRAEAAALGDMAGALELTAQALERDDDQLAEGARDRLRDLRDRLADLGRTRHASTQVVRTTPVWRSQLDPVVRESEDAGQLDLLGGSCLALTRAASGMPPSDRARLAPSVRELAAALSDLRGAPGDRATRQRAADRALAVARQLAVADASSGAALAAATTAVRMVAGDIMVFAGVDPEEADEAVQAGTGELRIPDPARTPHVPFSPRRWRPPG
jgi:hypothetical protein